MAQKEPLSRPVVITGVVVPLVLGAMAIAGNILTTRLQPPSATVPSSESAPPLTQSQLSVEESNEDGSQGATVKSGATGNVFSGKVFVAVTEIRTEEGSRNRVFFTLSSDDSGVKDERYKAIDAGYSLTFNGYKIRVMSVETDRASFRVTPLPAETVPEPTLGPRH